jgi:surfeit locus 1 family protein
MSPLARRTLIAFMLVTAVVCGLLGRWQLRRLTARRAVNAEVAAARSLPTVRLAPGAPRPDSLAHRRVTVSGSYDHEHELVLRSQAHEGLPGVHVVTPLRLEGSDTAVLVRRGFVPAPDAVTADVSSLREPGTVEVVGTAAPLRSAARGGEPLARPAGTTYRTLDLAAVRERLPYPVLDVVVQQEPSPGLPRLPRRVPPPALDDGPHLSYAVQWFSFMTIALVFAGVFWKKGREAERPTA